MKLNKIFVFLFNFQSRQSVHPASFESRQLGLRPSISVDVASVTAVGPTLVDVFTDAIRGSRTSHQVRNIFSYLVIDYYYYYDFFWRFAQFGYLYFLQFSFQVALQQFSIQYMAPGFEPTTSWS